MFLRSLPVLAAGLLLAATARAEDAAAKELEKLQGTWSTVSAKLNGEALPDGLVTDLKFVVQKDKVAVKGDAQILREFAQGTLKLDPSTTPKALDFKVGKGDRKGDVIEGIYQLKGDELTVCARLVGKERPAKFESPADSNVVLIVVKREKH
jgi:uncharacterized protein (TIGR03067 family)